MAVRVEILFSNDKIVLSACQLKLFLSALKRFAPCGAGRRFFRGIDHNLYGF